MFMRCQKLMMNKKLMINNEFKNLSQNNISEFNFNPHQTIKLLSNKTPKCVAEYINSFVSPLTIYDPFMKSGELLIDSYNYILTINPDIEYELYGTDIDGDVFDIGLLKKKLSLINKPVKIYTNKEFLLHDINSKYNIIISVLPFGTRYNFPSFKQNFMNINNINDIDFESVFPIRASRIESLVLQKMVYNLENNGILNILVITGFLFGRNQKEFRKWLSVNMNIHSITLILDKYSSIGSCILLATKNGITTNIQFRLCDKYFNLQDIGNIDNILLKNTDYSLAPSDYFGPSDYLLI